MAHYKVLRVIMEVSGYISVRSLMHWYEDDKILTTPFNFFPETHSIVFLVLKLSRDP